MNGPIDPNSRASNALSASHTEPEPMPDMLVSRLLEMGISTPKRPIDRLIDKLGMPGGSQWLASALLRPEIKMPGDPAQGLAEGKFTLAQVDAIKEHCKVSALTNADTNIRLASVAAYYLAIASAMVHHHKLISSQPRTELAGMLADLAAATTDPWERVLAKAALELGEQ